MTVLGILMSERQLQCAQLLAEGFFFPSAAVRLSGYQERREALIHKLCQLANFRYSSSLFSTMWEQEVTDVPWSSGACPSSGGRHRSSTTPWQCCFDLKGNSCARGSAAELLDWLRPEHVLSEGSQVLSGNRRRRVDNEQSWKVRVVLQFSSPLAKFLLLLDVPGSYVESVLNFLSIRAPSYFSVPCSLWSFIVSQFYFSCVFFPFAFMTQDFFPLFLMLCHFFWLEQCPPFLKGNISPAGGLKESFK